MGASAQGGMKPQQPQQPQQRPMGGQPQQGKGPGLPMPQQPQMGGNRPYQPVGANNGPFNPNPVQPVNQPPQMPAQGKAPGQRLTPEQMKYLEPMMQGQPMPPGAVPGAPMQPQVMPIPPGGGYPPIQPQIMPQQGKGPQSPFVMPAQTSPVQRQSNNLGLMQ